MLVPAQLYRDELKQKLIACWYKPEYAYYFVGEYSEFQLQDNAYWRHDFAFIEHGEVTGFFSYQCNDAARSISQFGLISFSGSGGALMVAVIRHIDQLIKEGLRRMDWWAVADNPATDLYARLIKRYHGYEVGRMHDCHYFNGRYHDSILYEVLFSQNKEEL